MLDETVALPFLSPSRERMLEYDVARAISQAITPQKPIVGLMSGLPVMGEFNPMMMRMGQRGQEPWVIVNELKRDFTVKEVAVGVDKIDDDIKVLVVIYPREISDAAGGPKPFQRMAFREAVMSKNKLKQVKQIILFLLVMVQLK